MSYELQFYQLGNNLDKIIVLIIRRVPELGTIPLTWRLHGNRLRSHQQKEKVIMPDDITTPPVGDDSQHWLSEHR
jgi:hypothetical protein